MCGFPIQRFSFPAAAVTTPGGGFLFGGMAVSPFASDPRKQPSARGDPPAADLDGVKLSALQKMKGRPFGALNYGRYTRRAPNGFVGVVGNLLLAH
jgi:hypothetical protein